MYDINLVCERFNTAVTKDHLFCEGKPQAIGTIIQVPHESSSILGSSRNSHRKRVCYDNTHSIQVAKRNRTKTKLPTCSDQQCPFKLRIILAPDNHWYLIECGKIHCSHTGHIFINPEHLHTPASLCSQEIHLFVTNLFVQQVTVSSIIGLVRSQFNLTLTPDQIRDIRDASFESRIEEALTINATSAERLIALLRSIPDMNFIYITHKIDSGFVTFKKSRNKKSEQIESSETSNDTAVAVDAIEVWRKDLGLYGGDSILVAVAWALDEEILEFEKYPEYVACDVTFGVNRNQRNLALCAVVDSNNHVSTFLRCLMPSKERRAYNWLFSVAFPFLLGSTLSKVSVLSMDNEVNMNQAYMSSVKAKIYGWSPFAKLRLDYFHMVCKPFMKAIVTDTNASVIKHVKAWIRTWFREIENEEEYIISKTKLLMYISSKSDIIGTHNDIIIQNILASISCQEDSCLHYHFKSATTLLFIGDSIIEACNGVLRKYVNANSTLANSSEIQTNLTRIKTHRKMW